VIIMSGISSAASGGPCNFSAPGPDFDFDDDEHDFVNPLEYFIAEIAPPYVPAPKAQKYPEVPIRTTDWDVSQGTKPAIKSTLVPFPFPGVGPAMKVDQPIPRGTDGLNTAIIIMVDRSGSMTSNAFPIEGRSLNRIEVARGLVCALIRLAQNQGDHFAVLSYGSSKYTEWPQSPPGNLASWKTSLSKDYETAFNYYSSYKIENFASGLPPPIPCTDGTDHSYAVEGIVEKLRGTGIDSVVSFVITDDFYNSNALFNGFFSTDPIAEVPRDTILRRNESTIYYFGIDNKGAEPRARRAAEELNDKIDEHYGRPIKPRPAHFFPLDPSDPDAARKMAQLMIELATSE
tara:strand:- start:305 stop:1342 length:1038 start_codon:yes stop_codon:yes gene_type:complete